MEADPLQRDHVQRPVQLAVAAPVEPVALLFATGGLANGNVFFFGRLSWLQSSCLLLGGERVRGADEPCGTGELEQPGRQLRCRAAVRQADGAASMLSITESEGAAGTAVR